MNKLNFYFLRMPFSFFSTIGFSLVYVSDGQLELCPGVTLASYSHLHPEDVAGLPKGVAYCYRKPDAAYMSGLKRLPRYVLGVPKIPGCEAISIPPVFHLTEVGEFERSSIFDLMILFSPH
jgi:hypothetical protein